ncbi:MAG: primosomal protein N' (replication factor Y) [Verrucomicrobiales bacterium]
MIPCARVAVDGSSDLEFDYRIPEELIEAVAVGSRVKVQLRNRKAKGTVLDLIPHEEPPRGLRDLEGLIHDRPILTPNLIKLAAWMADYYCTTRENVLRAMLPESVRADDPPFRIRKSIRIIAKPSDEEIEKLKKRAPRQAEILEQIQALKEPLLLTKVSNLAAAKALVSKGWARIEEQRVERDPHEDDEFIASESLELMVEQQAALTVILESMAHPERPPLLLHGVTGSGKTEVYLQATAKALEQGQTVIVLVPEISLTPQTVERFKSRFSEKQNEIAVLHSHLSQGERFDEWYKIHRNEARIVIGARSAIFAPLENLGLIIVDEEHESSYKQESNPRYHGRDIAVLRSRIEGCAIVLGSATPSLESYQNVKRDKYQLIRLSERVDDRSLPLVRVIDMKQESRKHKGPAILSERLRQEIEKRLEKREQIMLFLNRRGYANSMQCLECGHVCGCNHCSTSLTYHLSEQRLICHICGYKQLAPKRCPKCKSPSVMYGGFGTERAEEVIKKVFPQARMARIDADVMQRKNRLKETLRAFKTHKLDMLIGTQMIAKGLHFPNVTLVGILNADLGLHMPDFRAGERTFQLLTQVAGRAGRGHLEGEVVVQTFTPQSPSVQFARHHDFEGYSEQELEARQLFNLPPFTHACLMHVRSRHERLAEFTMENLSGRLRQDLPKGVIMGQPNPSPLERAQGMFRFQVMFRSVQASLMTRHIKTVMRQMTFPEEVIIIIDVDPFQMC